MIQQQEQEYVKAIYGMGDYWLAPEFQAYSVTSFAWSQKTPEQQRRHVHKVLNVIVQSNSNYEETVDFSRGLWGYQCRRGIFKSNLAQSRNHCLSLQSNPDLGQGAYCVTEFGNCVNVTVKGGSPTWRCRNSQSTAGLCSHILAVMDTMGTLPTF